MCTVTFIARQRGYCLGMNRDEKLTRAAAFPPTRKKIVGGTVLSPSEPGGGTWIAVNDSGTTFALINWYSVPGQVLGQAMSRGEVVNSVCTGDMPDFTDIELGQLPIRSINPFRLIGIFPVPKKVVEWSWDLKKIVRKNHTWKTQQWISSGFDELAAQRVRGTTFRKARQQRSDGSLDWLRRLHRSHSPQAGPLSTCMHRSDAATVSYTEVLVSPHRATMRYHAGEPCGSPECNICHLRLHEATFSAREIADDKPGMS
jgi:hypothetical protein